MRVGNRVLYMQDAFDRTLVINFIARPIHQDRHDFEVLLRKRLVLLFLRLPQEQDHHSQQLIQDRVSVVGSNKLQKIEVREYVGKVHSQLPLEYVIGTETEAASLVKPSLLELKQKGF